MYGWEHVRHSPRGAVVQRKDRILLTPRVRIPLWDVNVGPLDETV
jgi:hypothetical protein